MELQHFNVKLFVDGSEDSLESLIPIFHQWIQQKVFDELLLDVADYRHVSAGPGVILIGHEADYSVDNTDGRLGVLYNRKAPLEGTNVDRLKQATRSAITAFQKLDADARAKGKFRFTGKEIEILVNDRLLAPNTPQTRAAFEPELKEFCSKLFGKGAFTLSFEDDPRKRFAASVKPAQPLSAEALLASLAS